MAPFRPRPRNGHFLLRERTWEAWPGVAGSGVRRGRPHFGLTSSRLFIIFFIIIPFHHHLHSCSTLHIFDILLLTLFPFLSIASFLLISSLQHPSAKRSYTSAICLQCCCTSCARSSASRANTFALVFAFSYGCELPPQ